MKFYIVKNHPLLAEYPHCCVHRTPYHIYTVKHNSVQYYDTCNYPHLDCDNTIHLVADLSEDDLIVLTLSGYIVEHIVSDSQLDNRVFDKLKTTNI